MRHAALLLLFMAGCAERCDFPPGHPQQDAAPPAPSVGTDCARACACWRDAGAKDSEDVCRAFDDTGECTLLIPCEEACAAEPELYELDAGC